MNGYLYFPWFLSSCSLLNPLQSGFCIPVLHENSFCQGHQWPWPSKCSVQWSVLVPHLTGTLSSFWQSRWCRPLWNPVKAGPRYHTGALLLSQHLLLLCLLCCFQGSVLGPLLYLYALMSSGLMASHTISMLTTPLFIAPVLFLPWTPDLYNPRLNI